MLRKTQPDDELKDKGHDDFSIVFVKDLPIVFGSVDYRCDEK